MNAGADRWMRWTTIVAGDRDAELSGHATVLGSCLSRRAKQAGFRT